MNINTKSFIDSYKEDDSIISNINGLEYDYIFIYSPNYTQEIIDKFKNKTNIFIVHKITNFKYIYYKAKYFNKNAFSTFCKLNEFLYNIPSFSQKLRLFLLSKYSISLFENEKSIKNLTNKYRNKRIFIIGNGPSLSINDLDKLHGEITIACNMIYLAYKSTKWRPTYHMVEDQLDMYQNYNEFENMKGSTKIYPVNSLNNFKKIEDTIYYRYLKSKTSDEVSNSIEYGLYSGISVTVSMLQLAISMGAKEIYLLGNDFTYQLSNKAIKNSIYLTDGELNHFSNNYRKNNDLWVDPNYKGMLKQFKAVNQFAIDNNIKIYNASRKTELHVFEKINFDEVLS
ncbi:MAG: DUF115 domain-containing protein [Sulfurimonas sp.]|nr:DUF115 domain-containing protein [Sulfurimonas sp.]